MTAGRYAPSPSGDLHLGNLRTALLAWLFARSSGRVFRMRIEDLDRVRAGSERRQLDDLAALGLDWDPPVIRQSERTDRYAAAADRLAAEDRTYPCFCTRREIQQATDAPHAPPGSYPGTCRDLTAGDRRRRAAERPAALRLRADVDVWTVTDRFAGTYQGVVDDLVLRRNDGAWAYHLAVVVDDAAQDVDQVVRGDDLLSSAPRQAYLATLLGHPVPTYAHVPLALNAEGRRLAKRDGAVTWRELRAAGADPFELIAGSLGLRGRRPADLLDGFDPDALPREPWIVRPPLA